MMHEQWGRQVGARRKQNGLTQVALAAKLEIPQSTVSRIERGSMCPSDALKMRIVEALGCSLNDIFGWPMFLPPERPDTKAAA